MRNVICSHGGPQYNPSICTDGHKGAYIGWYDLNYSPSRVYVQHIDSAGYITWPVNGLTVLDTTITGFGPSNPHLVPDGNGGVIIAYTRTAIGGADHIYAQRMDANGQLLWNPPVDIDVSSDARLIDAVSDQHGGAIMNWYRYAGGTQVTVQWIDSTGARYLPANGLGITNNGMVHYDNHVAYAGNSAHSMAYVVWGDDDTLHLQAFDTSGTTLWSAPVALDTNYIRNSGGPGAGYAISPVFGTNKVCVVWESQRPGQTECARAQCVNANGNFVWGNDPVVVDSTSTTTHYPVVACTDGAAHGMYVGFGSFRTWVQHLNGQGQLKFSQPMVNCTTGGQGQSYLELVPDGLGGVIAGWEDSRGSLGVYAQRYDSLGVAQWRGCGSPVFNGYNVGSTNSKRIAPRYDGTAIASWVSGILGTSDIFAAKVENVSLTGVDEIDASGVEMLLYPNPAETTLSVRLSTLPAKGIVSVVDLAGKCIVQKEEVDASAFELPVSGLAKGVYVLTVTINDQQHHRRFSVK